MGVMGRCVEEEKEKGVCGLRGDVSLTEAATRIIFVTTKHVFVATKRLSRQKWYLWQLPPVIVTWPSCIQQARPRLFLSTGPRLAVLNNCATCWVRTVSGPSACSVFGRR